MASALVALGGNVGDVRSTFESAIVAIVERTSGRVRARSSDYTTPPWGIADQPHYVNACIDLETPLPPHALMHVLHDVEAAFGRNRAIERRNGPRTLDLDLLAYDDLTIDDRGLVVPHPRMFERAFVLVPLAEIAPHRPIGGRTARQALQTVRYADIERLPPRP